MYSNSLPITITGKLTPKTLLFPIMTISDAQSGWWWSLTNFEQVSVLVSYALGLLALSWVVLMFIKKSERQPPLPPGPKPWPLVGNLLSLDLELHTYFVSLAKDYGPILTIWMGKKLVIVISSPTVAKEVLKDQDTIFANRDVPAAALESAYGGRDIAWSPYGPEWRMLRKVCVREMLSSATLDCFYALRRNELQQTIKFLYSQTGKQVNVGEQMFLTVLNVITNMLWGGTVKGEERASLGAEFRQVVTSMTEQLGKPNLSDFYPSLARFDLQGVQKKTREMAQRFDMIFERMIEQRVEMGGDDGVKSKDFLQFLLQAKDKGDSQTPLTMTHLKALLMDMVIGGTDTTSNAVEFALAEVIGKPEVMRKVQVELDSVVGKDRMVEESDIPRLPYLTAVMKEALRLHPVLPLLIPRSPSKTCTVSGYTIPKGSRVLVNVWAVHRDPSIWENPSEFNPERFLQQDETSSKWDFSGNDLNYFPFGSSRRICAGLAMAERMFLISLASFLHCFEWNLPEGVRMDLTEKFGIVLKKKIPLVAIPVPRLSLTYL